MAAFASSYQPAFGAAVQRKADVLPLPFPGRPQALTVYIRFVEAGSIFLANRLVDIGLLAVATDVGFGIREAGGALYGTIHRNGLGSTVTSTLAVAPSLGDGVEILGRLYPDGSTDILQSINEAVATTAARSAALTLGAAWSNPLIFPNGHATGGLGFLNLRELVVERGVQSLITMRRLANVI